MGAEKDKHDGQPHQYGGEYDQEDVEPGKTGEGAVGSMAHALC